MKDDFENWLAEREEEIPADDGELFPGTVVGGYRIIARLGRGGFADVYRAEGENGDAVAIKILYRLDDKSRARFVRESEILSQIKHRNILRLLSFGSCGDRPYMVTELLREYELPSSDHRVAVFLRQIMSAAEELHRHGFIHRDIKPANILARDDGTPVLIDFGLASPISAAQRETDGLSVEGGKRIAVGTIGYAAPEQFNGLPVGREADVHAIGMLIKDCYQDKMPDCWNRIYLAATTSDPKSRYQTVQTLRRAVKRRHRRAALFIASLVALIGVIAFVCVYIPTHALGYHSTSASIKLNPVNAPAETGPYSIHCKVVYKDSSIPCQKSDGDCELVYVYPTNKELLSLLNDAIVDEYGEVEYEDILESCRNGDLANNIKDEFREFVDDFVFEKDPQAKLGVDILDVEVGPEGALKKDLEKESTKSSME